MSQFGFVNISFIWSNFTKETEVAVQKFALVYTLSCLNDSLIFVVKPALLSADRERLLAFSPFPKPSFSASFKLEIVFY